MPQARSHIRTVLALGLVILAFALLAMHLGQANGWDLRNYHLYNGWAFWTSRTQDFAAAQLQSYFNPLLAAGSYLLFMHTPPWLSSFVLGAIQGANVVPLFVLARHHLPESAQRGAPWSALGTSIVGALGATQLSELGSSIGDTLVSLPLLCAFVLAFARERSDTRHALLAAALVGATAGIKLTTAPFALGLVLGLPLAAPDGLRLQRFLLGGCAAALGFLVTHGFWMWHLWQEFGNPLHPLFGNLFGGEYAPPVSLRDARWLPRTLMEWLAYPLRWAAGAPRRVSEEWFLDLRVPLAFLAFPLLVWRVRRGATASRAMVNLRSLLLALAIAYLVWLALFGYYRYLAPLEMLAPLLLVLAVAQLTPTYARTASAILLGVMLLFTRPPQWGRLPHSDGTYLYIEVPALPQLERATVVLADAEPLAFLALGFPDGTRFVRIGGQLLGPPLPEYGMDREAARRLAASDGPLYALQGAPSSPATDAAFARQHLVRLDECRAVRSNLLAVPAVICPLRRAP